MSEEQAASPSPTSLLLEQEKRLDDAIRLLELMHGTLGHPDHERTKFYMKGRLDGIRYALRVFDV